MRVLRSNGGSEQAQPSKDTYDLHRNLSDVLGSAAANFRGTARKEIGYTRKHRYVWAVTIKRDRSYYSNNSRAVSD